MPENKRHATSDHQNMPITLFPMNGHSSDGSASVPDMDLGVKISAQSVAQGYHPAQTTAQALIQLPHEGMVIIIDEKLNILEANESALRHFQRREIFYSGHGVLTSNYTEAMRKINQCVQQSVDNPAQPQILETMTLAEQHWIVRLNRVHYLAEPDTQNTGVVVMLSLRPLKMSPSKVDRELLRRTFALTPTESMLCQGLSDGLRPRQLAESCGISYEHARQRIKVIIQKTQSRNQYDLLRLFTRFQKTFS